MSPGDRQARTNKPVETTAQLPTQTFPARTGTTDRSLDLARSLGLSFAQRIFYGLMVVISAVGFQIHSAPSASAADPSLRVKVEVRGVQRTEGFRYQYEMLCTRTNDTMVQTSENKEQLAVTVSKGETVTVGIKEFPTLTLDDACWIRAMSTDGSETTYKTTNGTRADGSTRDSSPGLIANGGYRSASALATGETITATHSYTGDLVVTNRVEGVPANGTAVVPVSIRCDNQGISRTLNLSDGDRELITGIPTGSSCRVSTLAGRSRTEDNSGSPSDGVVIISPIRSECLDLRNSSADCRATVGVTTAYDPSLDPTRVADPNESTTSTTTTTNPDDANRLNDPAQAAPATAAPAVAPAPAVAVDATPAFAG
jgi:hypothetical protein